MTIYTPIDKTPLAQFEAQVELSPKRSGAGSVTQTSETKIPDNKTS
jgi:hypothetical protein